jgi:hypothetical protein
MVADSIQERMRYRWFTHQNLALILHEAFNICPKYNLLILNKVKMICFQHWSYSMHKYVTEGMRTWKRLVKVLFLRAVCGGDKHLFDITNAKTNRLAASQSLHDT